MTVDTKTMNIGRLTQLAEWLEAGAPHKAGVAKFIMSTEIKPLNDCGTACCIAGAAVQFDRDDQALPWYTDSGEVSGGTQSKAKKLLGLTFVQADCLFMAYDYDAQFNVLGKSIHFGIITAPWAARCIRKLIATGIVDWTGTKEA